MLTSQRPTSLAAGKGKGKAPKAKGKAPKAKGAESGGGARAARARARRA